MKKIIALTAITLGLFNAMAMSQQAVAAGVNAYVLIEVTGNDQPAIRNKIGGAGLSNCKQLVEPLFGKDLVVSLACNEMDGISPAITQMISGVEGINKWTVWIVKSD